MTSACITVVRANYPARQFILDSERDYLIGRATDCDINIDDEEVSRHHARISCRKDVWEIRDLGSKNGVVVGGKPRAFTPLANNVWLGLGALMMRFETFNDEQLKRVERDGDARRRMTMHGRQQIDAATDVVDVLRKLLGSVLSVSATDRGFAMLTQADGDLEVACTQGVECEALETSEFRGSRGALREALATRRPVVTCDAAAHDSLAARQSVIAARTRALVCLPLTVLDRVVGVIYADSGSVGKFFTDLDVNLLEELAEHAALVIAASQLGDELDAVDRKLSSATAVRLAPRKHRIFDVNRPVEGGRSIPMTGIRWSQLDARE